MSDSQKLYRGLSYFVTAGSVSYSFGKSASQTEYEHFAGFDKTQN